MMKLEDFIEQRFTPDHILTLKRGGRIHFEVNRRHVVAELGSKPLREVKREDVQRLCAGLLAKMYTMCKDRARKVKDKATGKRVELSSGARAKSAIAFRSPCI
jgi:hypothetical protein